MANKSTLHTQNYPSRYGQRDKETCLDAIDEAMENDYFADDAGWLKLIEEHHSQHQTSRDQYALFRQFEHSANSFIKLIQLADAVIYELNDKSYARDILNTAEQAMLDEGANVIQIQLLVASISQHLGDTQWCKKILSSALERENGFDEMRNLLRTACLTLGDKGIDLMNTHLKESYGRITNLSVTSNHIDKTRCNAAIRELIKLTRLDNYIQHFRYA